MAVLCRGCSFPFSVPWDCLSAHRLETESLLLFSLSGLGGSRDRLVEAGSILDSRPLSAPSSLSLLSPPRAPRERSALAGSLTSSRPSLGFALPQGPHAFSKAWVWVETSGWVLPTTGRFRELSPGLAASGGHSSLEGSLRMSGLTADRSLLTIVGPFRTTLCHSASPGRDTFRRVELRDLDTWHLGGSALGREGATSGLRSWCWLGWPSLPAEDGSP